jgi:PilZ domain
MMQIAARLAIQGPLADQRRALRVPVSMSTDVRLTGYHGFDVVVRDISPLGFKVESSVGVKAKTLIGLRLPGLGMVLARVAWNRKGHIGGEFLNPIPPARLHSLIGYPRELAIDPSSV